MKSKTALGEFLRLQIEAKNIDKKELARKAGIQPGTLSKILSGGIKKPPRNRLEAFAEVLKIKTRVLVSLSEIQQ